MDRLGTTAQAITTLRPAPDGQWHWYGASAANPNGGDPAGFGTSMVCLDGSQTGFAMSLPASGWNNKVLIYMDGGGECFDKTSCAPGAAAPNTRYQRYQESDFQTEKTANATLVLGNGVNPLFSFDGNYDGNVFSLQFSWSKVWGARGLFDRASTTNVYQSSCKSVVKNTYQWVLLVGLTVLVLVRPSEKLSLLGVDVPAPAAHAVIVLSLVYLWLAFGATLKFVIVERMTLWKLADLVEGPVSKDRKVPLASIRPLLHGNVFLDGWFLTFLPEYALPWNKSSAHRQVNLPMKFVLWGAAAGAIGLAHACAFVLLWDAGVLWGTTELVTGIVWLAQGLTVLMIVFCYLYFQVEGHGKAFFFACSVAAAGWIEALPYLTHLRSAAH
jgi:hypothetical protein